MFVVGGTIQSASVQIWYRNMVRHQEIDLISPHVQDDIVGSSHCRCWCWVGIPVAMLGSSDM